MSGRWERLAVWRLLAIRLLASAAPRAARWHHRASRAPLFALFLWSWS
jgi:hypothetical protein